MQKERRTVTPITTHITKEAEKPESQLDKKRDRLTTLSVINEALNGAFRSKNIGGFQQ